MFVAVPPPEQATCITIALPVKIWGELLTEGVFGAGLITKLPADALVVALKFPIAGQFAVTGYEPTPVAVAGVIFVAVPPPAHVTCIAIGLPVNICGELLTEGVFAAGLITKLLADALVVAL